MKRMAILAGAVGGMLAATACQKKTSGPTGGGGGAWVVGPHGLMANIHADGTLGDGYALGSDVDLADITCRGKNVAFVVGDQGTMLRTYDGGASWESLDLGTTAALRAIAAQRSDTLYVAGDRVLVMSPDSGTTWRSLPVDPSSSWISVAAGHWSYRALALAADGRVIRYDAEHDTVTPAATLAGARVVAMSADGTRAVIAGAGRTLLRSDDAGTTWRAIDLGGSFDLSDASVTAFGQITAVGADGTIARIGADDAATVDHVGAGRLRTLRLEADGSGLAGGDDGFVLRTTNHGADWQVLDVAVGGTVAGVDTTDGDGW